MSSGRHTRTRTLAAYEWAWRQHLPYPSRLVLLALCDHVGKSTFVFPKVKTLAKMTGLDEGTVRKHLHKLEDVGLLTIHERFAEEDDGRRLSNGYRLHVARPPLPVAEGEGFPLAHTEGEVCATGRATPHGTGRLKKPAEEATEVVMDEVATARTPQPPASHPSPSMSEWGLQR